MSNLTFAYKKNYVKFIVMRPSVLPSLNRWSRETKCKQTKEWKNKLQPLVLPSTPRKTHLLIAG